jgi:hypothetical protein
VRQIRAERSEDPVEGYMFIAAAKLELWPRQGPWTQRRGHSSRWNLGYGTEERGTISV